MPRPQIERTCQWCKKPFMAERRFVNRGGAKYCGIPCRTAGNAALARERGT